MPSKTAVDNARAVLKRVTSVPTDISPPPPPPPPPHHKSKLINDDDDEEPRGAEIVEIVVEPTLKPSEIAKGMCRTMSALSECYNSIN